MNTYIFRNYNKSDSKYPEYSEDAPNYILEPRDEFTYQGIEINSVTDIDIQIYPLDHENEEHVDLAKWILGLDINQYNWYRVSAIRSNGITEHYTLPLTEQDVNNILENQDNNMIKPRTNMDVCGHCSFCDKGWRITHISKMADPPEKIKKSIPCNAFISTVFRNRITKHARSNIYKKYFGSMEPRWSNYCVTILLPFLDDKDYQPKKISLNTSREIAMEMLKRFPGIISTSDVPTTKHTNIKMETLAPDVDGGLSIYIQINGCDDFIVPYDRRLKMLINNDFPDLKLTSVVVLDGYHGPYVNYGLWRELLNEIERLTGHFNFKSCRDKIPDIDSCEDLCGNVFEQKNGGGVYMRCSSIGFQMSPHWEDGEICETVNIVVSKDMFHGWKNDVKYRCCCYERSCVACKLPFLTLVEMGECRGRESNANTGLL